MARRINKVLLDNTPSVASEVTVGTVPGNKQWEIHYIQLNNVNVSTDATIIIKLNDIIKANLITIPSEANDPNKSMKKIPYNYILNAGETIKVTVSLANAINIDVIGVEEDV